MLWRRIWNRDACEGQGVNYGVTFPVFCEVGKKNGASRLRSHRFIVALYAQKRLRVKRRAFSSRLHPPID